MTETMIEPKDLMAMGKAVLYMSMSVDGFIAGPNDATDNGLGDGGHCPLAKEAAGGNDVLVHGAVTAQLALTARVLDELQLHLIPVRLGQGHRLFEDMPADHIELELLRAQDGPGVHHLRYRVRPEG